MLIIMQACSPKESGNTNLKGILRLYIDSQLNIDFKHLTEKKSNVLLTDDF